MVTEISAALWTHVAWDVLNYIKLSSDRQKKIWSDVTEKECQTRQVSNEDAMIR